MAHVYTVFFSKHRLCDLELFFKLAYHISNLLILLLCLFVSIIAIHFCMVSPTLTSPNFNVSRIDWPALSQRHLLSLAVFHCFVPFIVVMSSLCYRPVYSTLKSGTQHRSYNVYFPSPPPTTRNGMPMPISFISANTTFPFLLGI